MVRLQGRSGETLTRLLLMTLYQTVLLKMLDIISIRKTGPRAHTGRLNVADDVLSVLNMFQNSPFIREVVMTCSSKPPSIILYTDLKF